MPNFLAACELKEIEACYRQARNLERDCCPESVDRYFEVVVKSTLANRHLHDQAHLHDQTSNTATRLSKLQRSATIKLLAVGQEFGRLHPASGLKVCMQGESLALPIDRRGFVWEAVDFDRLDPVGYYRTNSMWCAHRCAGVGIPLVVTNTGRRSSDYVAEDGCFAATLVVDVSPEVESCATMSEVARKVTITLYDPLRVDRVQSNGKPKPLARDLSAPLAFRLKNQRSSALDAFLQSDQVEGEGQLRMLEPYQSDKVPVVLIHGLLSNPFTWVQLANELLADAEFRKHFQIWVFTYPTGQPFVFNAAELRSQLAEIARRYANHGEKQYLSDVVLIGHSLGGLVAKLQVAESQNRLWSSVANRDFNEVILSAERRTIFRDAFFFTPSPQVSRVIYIGTPHGGSNYARRLVGRLGSALVRPSTQNEELHEQLIAYNPGVFSEEITRGIPTSIDMMEPNSCLLQAIRELPVNPRVQMHSVIGDCHWSLTPGDGVVPVDSARLAGARSEVYVDGKHGELNKLPESIQEVRRILALHLSELPGHHQHGQELHRKREPMQSRMTVQSIEHEHASPTGASDLELHWREVGPTIAPESSDDRRATSKTSEENQAGPPEASDNGVSVLETESDQLTASGESLESPESTSLHDVAEDSSAGDDSGGVDAALEAAILL